jgi:hypothetical protein
MTPAEQQDAVNAGVLEVDALVQVTFSPQVLPGLISALVTQRQVYEQMFGPIRELP